MKAIYCGDYTALATTKWGAKVYVDTRDTSLAPHIMLEGDWEPWVTNCMATFLQKHKGCTFIDVGANVGWYTLLACGLGARHVFSFEPNPRMVELLRKTITVNGFRTRVTLTKAACGAESGCMRLVVDVEESGGAHLAPLRQQYLANTTEVALAGADACRIVRLDDIVLPEGTTMGDAAPQYIVKIDVEGFEPQVLAGANRLMQYHPVLFLEHAQDAEHQSMYLQLMAAGYSLHHVQHTGHRGPPLLIEQLLAHVGTAETVLCLPPGYGGT